VRDARGFDPSVHFVPADRVVIQHPGDLMKINARAAEDIGDFRHGARRAMCQPVARHRRAVAQRVGPGIINRRCRGKIQNNDGNFGALHHRQHDLGE
jgi:hypothetical protein